MARRVVLQGIAGAVAGGNPAMRPDQALQPLSRAGVGPSPQNNRFVGAVYIIGPAGVIFTYSPTVAPGNLVASTGAPAPGTDHGNAYLSGDTVYGTIAGTSYAVQMGWSAGIGTSVPIIAFYTAASPAGPYTRQSFIDGDNLGNLVLTSAGNISFGVGAGDGTFLGGYTDLANVTAPGSAAGHARPFASGGNLVYVNGVTGDAQTYDTGTFHLVTSPAFTVSATVFPNAVPGVTVALGIGHYRFRCVINCTTAAGAGAPQFEFTFPSATGVMMQTYTPLAVGGNAQSNQNNFSAATSLSLAVGPTLNTHGFICVWEGDLTTTAAGNLALNAITNTLGDNYVVATAWLDLYPVN